MAVKLRLIRMGKKRTAYYRVVVMDGRSPRDGRYIEQIGVYDPHQQPSKIEIDNEKAIDWMKKGAQPTDPVRKLLEISGAMSSLKVATGKIHTVGSKPAPVVAEVEAETPEAVVAEVEAATPEAVVAEVEAETPEAVVAEVEAETPEVAVAEVEAETAEPVEADAASEEE
jgi:small subunit ribosomal protein S16